MFVNTLPSISMVMFSVAFSGTVTITRVMFPTTVLFTSIEIGVDTLNALNAAVTFFSVYFTLL